MSCHVVETNCEYPPGLAGLAGLVGRCRTRCFACGLDVCRNCSTIREWHRHGRRRVCNTCDADDQRLRDRKRRGSFTGES